MSVNRYPTDARAVNSVTREITLGIWTYCVISLGSVTFLYSRSNLGGIDSVLTDTASGEKDTDFLLFVTC